MQRPTAVPMIPASASGVSTQRSAPKRSRSPAVARKTPPALPPSSPITSTFESRSSSTCRQSLTASTMESSAIALLLLLLLTIEDPPQLRELVLERGWWFGEGSVEEERGIGRLLGLRLCDAGAHGLER